MKREQLYETLNHAGSLISQAQENILIEYGDVFIAHAENGSVDYEEFDDLESITLDYDPHYLCLSITTWAENGRSTTQAGREELKKEEKAVEEIISYLKSRGFKEEDMDHSRYNLSIRFVEETQP